MKILISDYDGTFNRDDGNILNNIKAVTKFRFQKNIFIIATNRNLEMINEELSKYNIPYDYLILSDGGLVINGKGKEIFRQTVDRKAVLEISNILKDSSLYSEILFDNGYKYVDDGENVVRIEAYHTDKEASNKLLESISKKNNQVSGNFFYKSIAISHPNVNKYAAIKRLLKILNLPSNIVYTIGDNKNDYEMIGGFNGFMIENSYEELKKVAKGSYSQVSDLIYEIINDSEVKK